MAVYMHTQDCLNFLVNFSVHYSIKMNLSFKNVLFTSISIPASFLFVFTCNITCYFFCSVQSLSPVRLFATPCTAARQTSLSITNSRSSLKLMSIESVMPSNHLVLCHLLLLLPSIFPSIKVFSNESVLHIRKHVINDQVLTISEKRKDS